MSLILMQPTELSPTFLWIQHLVEMIGIGGMWSIVITYAILSVVMFGVLALLALFLVWWERKFAGHIQQRFGPMMTGWHGWYQTIMDAVKLLQKEDILVVTRDRMVFFWAPILAFRSGLCRLHRDSVRQRDHRCRFEYRYPVYHSDHDFHDYIVAHGGLGFQQ